jgi:hypothetical protein
MKPILAIALALLFTGCATSPNFNGIQSVYTDQSTSPLTREQAFEIGKREAMAREGFVDEPRIPDKTTKLVSGSANRINQGGRVIARQMVCTNGRDGASAWMDVPAAVVTIDSEGRVVDYTRHSLEEVYKAERASASNGG